MMCEGVPHVANDSGCTRFLLGGGGRGALWLGTIGTVDCHRFGWDGVLVVNEKKPLSLRTFVSSPIMRGSHFLSAIYSGVEILHLYS